MALTGRGVTGGSDINVLVDPGADGDMQVLKLAYSTLASQSLVTADAKGLMVLPSNQVASSATVTSQADQNTNVTLFASNPSRKGAIIVNDSTEILYVKFGATATTTDYTYKLVAGATLEFSGFPVYTGIVDGIWAANASGSARMTEL